MVTTLLIFATVESKNKGVETEVFSIRKKKKQTANQKNILHLEEIKEKTKESNENIEGTNLNIATHNINGLKKNNQKIEKLYEWLIDNEIDIISLSEMNISSKEAFFITRNMKEYKSFWANSNPEKKKGSGVGILINEHWEKHLGGIDRTNENMIIANFLFKQLEIVIIMLYMPPNNREEHKKIQRAVIEKYIKRSQRTQMIIMGDFNSVVNNELDRSDNPK